eukprot:5294089-Amphidinium_carterae.1
MHSLRDEEQSDCICLLLALRGHLKTIKYNSMEKELDLHCRARPGKAMDILEVVLDSLEATSGL